MSGQRGRVVVVGAGVIGVACAHYLERSGWAVELIDRGTVGGGCSHANCGLVCPSHVLPLAAPGAVRDALRALLSRNSPFAIKPRLDPALWAWLLRFARRCNAADMLEAGRGIQALLESSRALFAELFANEPLDAEWETRGLLFVFRTAAALEHHGHTVELLSDRFGVGAKRYDADALQALEPALLPGLAGGWHYANDAHLRPDRLMASWRELLESRGVAVRENCEFRGFVRQGRMVRAVETVQGPREAEAVVVAAGAWTPLLRRHLGCRVPIQPGKGYSITMPRPEPCPAVPMIFEEHRVAVTPMKSGYRLGSTMEFAGYDATINRRRLDLLREGAGHYLRRPVAGPVLEEWAGWRPMTPSGLPLIGRCPGLDNVYVAAGHNMLGLSMAPATGRLVAELLAGETPHIDPGPYQVG
jgi:D-amino-acid dehydrogenase